jgi:HK97 family phage major capsid protein
VDYTTLASEFIEFLRPQTIIGKFGTGGIPSLRRIPFNVRMGRQTSGGSGYWVGQGKPKPLTKFAFDEVTLRWAKVANIAVLTEDLIRFSNPSADALVQQALADALRERMDIDFVDPAKAESANISPASITNGVVGVTSSGTDADAVRTDVQAVMQKFIAANITPTTGVWIMSASNALALSLMTNALGQPEFPGITMTGGTFVGLPVITSEYMTDVADSSGSPIILVNASDVFLADDGGIMIDASREASLEMLDSGLSQDATNGTGASLVSMFQTNSVAMRAERVINWKKRRAEAVAMIVAAAYTAASA